MPYNTEAGPFNTSTRSVVVEKLCDGPATTPLRKMELSRFAPKPRFNTASKIPPKVFACVVPLTVVKASSMLVGLRSSIN